MKRALLVVDMQSDYLCKQRKSMFTYDTKKVIKAVNNTIEEYKNQNYDIIYIKHIVDNNFISRRVIEHSLKNTIGSELYSELRIVSNLIFQKKLSSAYSSIKFKKFMKNKSYEEIVLCGLDLVGCVGKTALSAAKREKSVSIKKDATFTRFSKEKADHMTNKLISLKVNFI